MFRSTHRRMRGSPWSIHCLWAFAVLVPFGRTQECAELQKLFPPGGPIDGEAGYQVAIDGDVLVLGSQLETVGGTGRAGAVYIFRRDSTSGRWMFEEKLSTWQPNYESMFGAGLSIDGDRMAIAEPGARSREGEVHLFDWTGIQWVYDQSIVASVGQADSNLGFNALALRGDLLLVGSFGRDTAAGRDSGLVHVFEHDANGWTETSTFAPQAPQFNEQFGFSLSLQGTTCVVGAPLRDVAGVGGAGAAFVFEQSAPFGPWTEVAELNLSAPYVDDEFGQTVDIAGDWIVVGAPNANPFGENTGTAVVYRRRADGTIREFQTLQGPAPQKNDRFGKEVCLNADSLVVTAPYVQNKNGRAYRFRYCDRANTWDLDAVFAGSQPTPGDMGMSAKLDGDRVVIGAPFDTEAGHWVGACFVFGVRDHEMWIEPSDVQAGETATLSAFYGPPGGVTVRFIVHFDGSPFLAPLGFVPFDSTCWASQTGTVPTALAGHSVGFLSFTIEDCGDLVASPVLTHTF